MQTGDLRQYHERVRRLFDRNRRFLSFDRRYRVGWGYDHQPVGTNYLCKGEYGRGEASRVVFQFGLDGRGEYVEKNRSWIVEPGSGFIILHPSKYYYTIPPGEHWAFFWFIVDHPFVVSRIKELRMREAAVQSWPAGSPALEAAVTLFEQLCSGQITKLWSFEERLFTWLWETERELYSRRYPEDERERYFESVRRSVLQRLDRPPSVSELADAHQMERTTFSRKFKDATGKSPAAFITEVRLEEALKQLRTGAKLKEIAAQTGFADANHFSKTFRQHFNVTPGVYRKLILMRQ